MPYPTAPAREQLIESHFHIAECFCKRVWKMLSDRTGHGLEKDDVLQTAKIGLIEAADSFDPSQGAAFGTWAFYKVKGEMCELLRSLGYSPQAKQLATEEEGGIVPESMIVSEENDIRIDVRNALNALPSDQRDLLVAVHFDNREHADLAKEHGCCTKTIQRNVASAQVALKRLLNQ
jgi:RNA polymerase sigma factor (sigma-70 family)